MPNPACSSKGLPPDPTPATASLNATRQPLLYWPVVATAAGVSLCLIGGMVLSLACVARVVNVAAAGQERHLVLAPPVIKLVTEVQPRAESVAPVPPPAAPAPPKREEPRPVARAAPPPGLPSEALPGPERNPGQRPASAQTLTSAEEDIGQIQESDPVAEPALRPEPPPETGGAKEAEACETCGTSVRFVSNPQEAARRAAGEQKLLMVLHISGNFEDKRFT